MAPPLDIRGPLVRVRAVRAIFTTPAHEWL